MFIIIGYIVSICLALCFHSCNWGAGSYSFSEVYYINLPSSDELIDTIKKVKHSNPELNVYYKNEKGDTVIMDEYDMNFYICRYLIDDIAYMCAINVNQKKQKKVSLQLVSICKKDKIDRGGIHWKQINTDEITESENEEYKSIFEKVILNHLGIPWRRMKFVDYFDESAPF